jgi:magnesium-transporting ATPase (P-type)
MGKEGNQAASFADYAVPRYKDLRRALFWHGRNYGNRMINLVCFCLFKSMINATTKYCMQFENGFSGQQPVDGLLLSLYNVTMTVWFMFGCSYLDQDVSNRKYGRDESKMPYTMSEAYIYGRTYQSRIGFCKLILWKDAYSLICGFIIYYAFYFGQGSMGFAGKMFGLWSYGVFATVACVVIHHVECAMYCRNWDINLVAWFTLSICLLPLTCLGQNFIPKSDLFRCIWQILGSARILSMLVFAICSVSMPLYAYKSWYQVIQYPKFYTQD